MRGVKRRERVAAREKELAASLASRDDYVHKSSRRILLKELLHIIMR